MAVLAPAIFTNSLVTVQVQDAVVHLARAEAMSTPSDFTKMRLMMVTLPVHFAASSHIPAFAPRVRLALTHALAATLINTCSAHCRHVHLVVSRCVAYGARARVVRQRIA